MTSPEKKKSYTGRFLFCVVVLLAAGWLGLDYKGLIPQRFSTGIWAEQQETKTNRQKDKPKTPVALTPENFLPPEENKRQGSERTSGGTNATPGKTQSGAVAPIFNTDDLKNLSEQNANQDKNTAPNPVDTTGQPSKNDNADSRQGQPPQEENQGRDVLPELPDEKGTALTIPKENSDTPAPDHSKQTGGDLTEKQRLGENKSGSDSRLKDLSPAMTADNQTNDDKSGNNKPDDNRTDSDKAVETELRIGQGGAVSPENNAVRGKTPQVPKTVSVKPKNADSMVLSAFFDSFAQTMADNFWPRGTHPQAVRGDFSSADVKWLNSRYGLRLTGFAISDSTPQNRERILKYVLTPSMLKALYSSYGPEFFAFLSAHADSQLRQKTGKNDKIPFSIDEKSRMFSYYSRSAASLSSIIKSCLSNAEIGDKVVACLNAEEEAHVARARYLGIDAENDTGAGGGKLSSSSYQAAVVKRERARTALAAAIRRTADTRQFDQDSLVFIACWLNRRSASMRPALFTLADILRDLSGQFARMSHETTAAGK